MGERNNPYAPSGFKAGLAAADNQPTGDVGQICTTCPDNWVEAGAVDEATGEPIPGIGYRIYEIASGDMVASGILNDKGESPRHDIPMPATQLYAVFGTEEAMDEAEEKIEEMQRQQALRANAVQEWRGFEPGLDKDEFSRQHRERIENGDFVDEDRGFLEGAASGAEALWDLGGSLLSGDSPREWAEKEYARRRDDAWGQYQLATGARAASGGESFGAGTAQGVTFNFDEEIGAGLSSLFDERSYEEIVAARRQIIQQQRTSNPGAFLGGEIAGAIPTIFIPVGGAAANTARAGQTTRAVIQSGAKTGAITGGLAGAGRDEGGVIDRLDGAAIGAVTGGVGGAVLSGAGVLIARGVSRTRIWGRISGRATPKREPFHRPNLNNKWYRADDGTLDWPPNNGFANNPTDDVLAPGTRIDRYSGRPPELDGGQYFSPAGASFESRALPYNQATQRLSTFEVVRPIPVKSGSAASWFDQVGGATQHMTEMSTRDLLEQGFIRVVQ